jgi:hypothetical protein
VVLGLDSPHGDKKTTELMELVVRECGASGRTYKSAVLFAVPASGEAVREATRNLLAWEDIDDDDDTKKRLDDGQRRQLQRNLESARRGLEEAVFRAYRYVYLLGKDNALRSVDLGQITSSSAGSIVELILRELGRGDEIASGISPAKLVKSWPGSVEEWSTKAVRDALFSTPHLPRVLDPELIRRTISDGVSQGVLGYATRNGGGPLRLLKFKESLSEVDVEVSDDAFVLKAEDAQKLLEPPRLESLELRPAFATVRPGEQVAFTCTARDQYGNEFPGPSLVWNATGGIITPEGMFTAGEGAGLYAVRALAGGREAIVEVRVGTGAPPAGGPPATVEQKPGKQTIRWRGTVPPQKWMNFYTKVLSRFASSPELKLEVVFEVALDSDQADAKADEARVGLKELGLSDDVTHG